MNCVIYVLFGLIWYIFMCIIMYSYFLELFKGVVFYCLYFILCIFFGSLELFFFSWNEIEENYYFYLWSVLNGRKINVSLVIWIFGVILIEVIYDVSI